jgi:hypothetical protein
MDTVPRQAKGKKIKHFATRGDNNWQHFIIF